MNSKPKGALSNPTLKEKQVGLTKASAVIQLYVQMILHQPDLKLKALPDLPSHQKTARGHADNWNVTILPFMSKTDADIIDYANKFDAFYGDLVKYAKDVKNPESKKKLVEGLQLLLSTIKKKDANVEAVVKDLSKFQKDLSTDCENFSGDVKLAAIKIEGESGEIKALSRQLDVIHSEMQKDIYLMAGGVVAIIAGVAIMVIGLIAEIPSGGASTALIGGGFLIAGAGGVTMETLGAANYSSQIDKQRGVQERLVGDKKELAGLKTTKAHVTGFLGGLAGAITATTHLKAAWQALDADLEELITAIKDVDPDISSDWLVDELNRAKKDWQVALDQAKRLQPDGKVPITLYKNLQDAFKEMKPRGKA